MQSRAMPAGDEWRTPHERELPEAACCAHERDEFERSVAYLRRLSAEAAAEDP